MAKKRALRISQAEFTDSNGEEWTEKAPKAVQQAADAYEEAHGLMGEAREDLNTSRDNVIAKMKEHGCTRVLIRNGEKYLELQEEDKILIRKRKEQVEAE